MSDRNYTIYSAEKWKEDGEECSVDAYWDCDGDMILAMTLEEAKKTNLQDGDYIVALVPLAELEAMERERAEMLALLHRVVFAEGDLTIEETKMVESFIARVEGTP